MQGATTNWTQNYGYDNLGNRSMLTSSSFIPFPGVTPEAAQPASPWVLGQTLTTGPFSNNRWTQSQVTYDGNGNMTSNTAVSSAAATVYDAENRVQTVGQVPSIGYLRYYYDGDG